MSELVAGLRARFDIVGRQQELEDLLVRLVEFAAPSPVAPGKTPEPARLPRTVAKLKRMLRRLRQQGFTAWVE